MQSGMDACKVTKLNSSPHEYLYISVSSRVCERTSAGAPRSTRLPGQKQDIPEVESIKSDEFDLIGLLRLAKVNHPY